MSKCKLLLLSLIVFVVQFQGHQGCHEEERRSLLKLKAYMESYGSPYADSLLPSWVDDDPQSECCLWDRVVCSNITDHVIELSLGELLEDSYEQSPFDLSVLKPFKELRHLNFSWNRIIQIQKEGFSALTSIKTLILASNYLGWGSFLVEELSVLENLEFLDLKDNFLEGSPTMQGLKTLSKLSKLKHLDLSYNYFDNGMLRMLEFFPSLKSIYLSYNSMWGSLSEQDIKHSTRLEILDLSWNDLVGNIPSKVGKLASLRALSLAGNSLNGSFPGICELKRLQELDLYGNSFDGILPPCLNNLTSLRYIDIGGNHFEGSFKFRSLANHSKLRTVILSCDGDKLKTDAEDLHQIPLFQLEVLQLSNCNLKNIPRFLLHQHRLRAIDLSHNKLNGMFPAWLSENNTDLEFLNLRDNSFSGQFLLTRNSTKDIVWVDVSSNHFNGQLQDDFGEIFSNAQFINLSSNYFEGDLPSSICVTRKLEGLDLSFNNFSGEVPKEFLAGCTNLDLLWFSDNKFHGEIFSSHFNLSHLSYLELRNNQFSGSLSLPKNVDLSSLLVFDVGNNQMTGEIPRWITSWDGEGEVTSMGILALNNNFFEGHFPCQEQLFSIQYLDISHNSLRGPLPYCFNQDYLKGLNLEGNRFSGSIPSALFNFSALMVLNLGDNHLSGSIPNLNINGTLTSLRVLSLAKNNLSGLIPKLLCQLLTTISMMDLSNNFFSGPIPQCFYNFSFRMIMAKRASYPTLSQQGFNHYTPPSYSIHGNVLQYPTELNPSYSPMIKFVSDFVTKNRHDFYKGDILDLMSGLDLSCNNLTGKIPSELGNLSSLHALNLSYNRLVGSIPISFSNLAEIESLDLSYNYLSGEIPLELTNLLRLEVFSVAHNNLSGQIPFKNQFATFVESSYKDNPLLCGLPLNKSCTNYSLPIVPSDEREGKWLEVDSVAFYSSFSATYLVFLLGFVIALFINPYWRRRWFHFVENFLYSIYYFAYDTLGKLSRKLWN